MGKGVFSKGVYSLMLVQLLVSFYNVVSLLIDQMREDKAWHAKATRAEMPLRTLAQLPDSQQLKLHPLQPELVESEPEPELVEFEPEPETRLPPSTVTRTSCDPARSSLITASQTPPEGFVSTVAGASGRIIHLSIASLSPTDGHAHM